jgi:hypothetical protein
MTATMISIRAAACWVPLVLDAMDWENIENPPVNDDLPNRDLRFRCGGRRHTDIQGERRR